MIKATGHNRANGRRLTVLGLSGENITRLVANEPILFNGKEIGIEGEILIFYGKTQEDLMRTNRLIYRQGLEYGQPGASAVDTRDIPQH